MVTDALRRRLYDAAARTWGPDEAAALMELLPPSGWSDLVRQSDLREGLAGVRLEIADVRADVAELRGEVAELRGEIGAVRGEIGAVRSELKGDIAELRGELRAQLPRLVLANLGSMLAIAALVAAIVRIG